MVKRRVGQGCPVLGMRFTGDPLCPGERFVSLRRELGPAFEAIEIDSQTCVRTIHRGPYQKIGDTYKEIVDWAVANDVELANHTMESYINDPTAVAREDIETLILIPVVGAPAGI